VRTWSAKEYKGHIYTGDMGRGFDVYAFASCEGLGCVAVTPNAPGKASGGGRLDSDSAELLIVRGTAAGGKATFGFSAALGASDLAPTGNLTFNDHASKKSVKATSIESFSAVGNKATFSGRATVNNVPGVSFWVEVEDFGEPGDLDTFRLVLGDGYGAGGTLSKGNIQVESGGGLVP